MHNAKQPKVKAITAQKYTTEKIGDHYIAEHDYQVEICIDREDRDVTYNIHNTCFSRSDSGRFKYVTIEQSVSADKLSEILESLADAASKMSDDDFTDYDMSDMPYCVCHCASRATHAFREIVEDELRDYVALASLADALEEWTTFDAMISQAGSHDPSYIAKIITESDADWVGDDVQLERDITYALCEQ